MVSNDDVDIQKVWQSQSPTALQMTSEELRTRVAEMAAKDRRGVYDSYAVFALISVVVIALAVISSNLLMGIGAALSVLGFGFIIDQGRRRLGAKSPEEPDVTIRAYRLALEKRRDFIGKSLWTRLLCVTPGPLLFSIGFAAAYPKAAPIIYVQIATFVIVLIAIVPINRRKMASIQREIDELRRLESDDA